MRAFQNNTRRLCFINGLRFINPLLPIYLLYADHFGLNYEQIFLTQVVFAIALIIFEMPMGVMADCIGQKKALLIGAYCAVIGTAAFTFIRTFQGFIIAEISMAMSYAAFSGADTALLYMSLKQLGKLDQYVKKESELQAYGRYAEAISGISCGLLMKLYLILPAFISFIASIIGLWITSHLTDAKQVKHFNQQNPIVPQIITQLKKLIGQLYHDVVSTKSNQLLPTFLYSAAISATTLSTFWLLQVYYKEYAIPLIWLGVIWLLYHTTTGIASQLASYLMSKISNRILILLLPLSLQIMSTIMSFAHSLWSLPFFFIASIVYGLKMPLLYTIIHEKVSDTARSSMISLDSLLSRLFFCITAIVIGYLLNDNNLNNAFLFLMVPNIIAISLAVLMFRKSI
ncbi:MAG: hypothetical protein A3F17_04555 [Gammaproteobacteria bacterium RIFCSPHIGHO2_12_FULL_41_15]|nr:MAG: hypothetical protein A3F17_04555 [Gammaproteobacteria bacterium RIFCSPHIGHO2_12_FULL_41_15]